MPGKNKRRRKLYERIAAICEVEQDYVSSVPVLTFHGRHEIEVDGCSGILEYGPERIVLALRGDRFTVVGDCLTLADFRSGVLYVRGNVKGAAFGYAVLSEENEC